jgi:hypothetical protein
MKNNLMILFVFLGQCQLLSAQNNLEKIITGTVVSNSAEVEGISVLNSTNKMIAVTDKKGCFSIEAKQGDILSFSGIDYKNLSKYVYKFEYDSGIIEVNMTFNSIELDEVVINKYANLTAEKFGIIPSGQIKLTQQERKLYSNSGGIMGLYSTISGERHFLKMNVETEKKEMLMKKLEFMFDDKYYTQRLKIPAELIKGFQYYCVEDSEFVKSIHIKNKTKSMFLMTNLASVYNRKRLEN